MARIEAGMRCLIIGSANGPKGLSVGRKCVTMFKHPIDHTLHGPIWHVKADDGKEFISEYGATGPEVDCAEDWLVALPPEPPNETPRIAEKDLQQSN